MAGARGRRSALRRWSLLLGLAALGFALGLGLALERRAIAERLLLARLRAVGLTDARLDVTRFDWGVLELGALTGFGGALSLERLEIRYSLAGLRQRRLDQLRARGLRLRGSWADDRVSFGGAEALAGDADRGAPLALAPARAALEDGSLVLETAHGPLELALRAEGTLGAEGELAGGAWLEIRHPLLRGSATLEAGGTAHAPSALLALDLEAAGTSPSVSLRGAALSLEARLEATQGALALWPTRCVRTRVERLGLPGPVQLDAPLETCVEAGAEEPMLRLAREQDGLALAVRFDVPETAVALRSGSRRVTGRAPRLRVRRDGPVRAGPQVALDAAGGRLRLREPAIELSALDASARLGAGWLPEVRVRAVTVTDLAQPARLPPLELAGGLRPEAEQLAFSLTARDAGSGLELEASGSHDPGAASGRAELRLKPLRFAAGGLQPERVLPALRGRLSAASGALEAIGALRWGRDAGASVDVALRDLGATTPLARVERLNGVLRLVGPPLSTPTGQLLSMAALEAGIALQDGLVAFALRPDGVLAIEEASWRLAGGRLVTDGSIDLRADEQALVLRMEDLDLGALLELARLEGLSGSGRLAGRIPIVRRGARLEIRDAVLAAAPGGGRIRYRPVRPPAAIRSIAQLDLLLAALSDFQYETLELHLSGDPAATVTLGVDLRGANPGLQQGRPVEFHLRLEGELGDVLRAGGASHRIPEAVEARLLEFARRRR